MEDTACERNVHTIYEYSNSLCIQIFFKQCESEEGLNP